MVASTLARHPDIAGLEGTGVDEDEGQHVQDVYGSAGRFGGPGRFAFNPAARMTESHRLVRAGSAERIHDSWAPYWSSDAPWKIEKSPPNLIRMRFLQALFPDSSFLVVLRHPVGVSLATKRFMRQGRRTPMPILLAHWLRANQIARQDARHIERVRIIRYEDFVAEPAATLAELHGWMGLSPTEVDVSDIRDDGNERYLQQWVREGWGKSSGARMLIPRIQRHGYTVPAAAP